MMTRGVKAGRNKKEMSELESMIGTLRQFACLSIIKIKFNTALKGKYTCIC